METTYEKQRRPRGRTSSHRAKKNAMNPRERRRLLQLAVSIGIFALVFIGRGIFPTQMSQWKNILQQDIDFKSAFSSLGQAISDGQPVMDTLGDLWVEVFAGGAEVQQSNVMWNDAPTFSQRLEDQMTHPGDAVQTWYRQQLTALAARPAEQSAGEQSLPAAGEKSAAATQKLTQTPGEKTIVLGGETLIIQSALPAKPTVVTAVAQAYSDSGEMLPDAVSMKKYSLGLEKTVTPVLATLTSDYGYRDHPVTGNYVFHRGVDIGAPVGTDILAFAGGTVEFVGESAECGIYVQIDHGNGVKTFYAHCSKIYVRDGEQVTVSQKIAAVGETGNATGPHLHFSIIKDGIYLDPLYYIEVN